MKEMKMSITLPDLPFAKNSLEPFMSAKTIEFHHDKHHNGYVQNANKLITGTEYEKLDAEEIIQKTAGDAASASIFNNVSQAWNHAFYWQCLKPKGGGKPSGQIEKKIKQDFGGYEKFVEELKSAGSTQFGSGWAWLVMDNDRLEVMKTANADSPLAHDMQPLLTIDVWEHAYYLDYQNRRPDYINTFIEKLINWEFVNSLLE